MRTLVTIMLAFTGRCYVLVQIQFFSMLPTISTSSPEIKFTGCSICVYLVTMNRLQPLPLLFYS